MDSSFSLTVSETTSEVDSATISQSKVISEQDSSSTSYAGSTALSNSKVMSTNLSATYAISTTGSQNLSVVDSASDVIAGNVSDIGDLWTIRLSKTSRVAGIALIGDPTTSSTEFVVMTDSFKVIDTAEGYAAKLVFTTGLVGGVGAVGINGNVLIDGTVAATQLAASQVITSTAQINDAMILTAKISDAQITTAKISNAAIISAKISDLQVTGAKIADTTIVGAKISNAVILTAHISNAQITEALISNLAVTNAKISSLDVDKLTAGSFTSKKITLALTPGGGDVAIQSGKTDFTNSEVGFILGRDDSDSDLPKFYIGTTEQYFNFTGAAINYRGPSEYYGDRGDGTVIKLASILAQVYSGSDYCVAWFGAQTSSRIGVIAESNTNFAIEAVTNASGKAAVYGWATGASHGVSGNSVDSYGGYFSSTNKVPLFLVSSGSAALPSTSATVGALAITNTGVLCSNRGTTTWMPVGINMKVGSFEGNGSDNRYIDIGLDLDSMSYVFLILKNVDSATEMTFRDSGMSSDNSYTTGIAMTSNMIQAFSSSGFQVGTSDRVNKNGATIEYIVFYQL